MAALAISNVWFPCIIPGCVKENVRFVTVDPTGNDLNGVPSSEYCNVGVLNPKLLSDPLTANGVLAGIFGIALM